MSWILLRGLTREARHWHGFPATLTATLDATLGATLHATRRAQAPIAPVAAIDLPGNGADHAMSSPATVSEMAAYVRSRASARGLRKPYSLVALSLGGMVATTWAQSYPDEIERLVLINTSMRPFGRPHQRLRWQAWARVLEVMWHWRNAHRCEMAIHRLTCANATSMDDDLRRWTAMRAEAPVSRRNALRQLMAAARFSAGGMPPRCPTLILSSAADRLVSPACSAMLAQHWNCRHAVHPHAGHDLPHDDPAWVARQIAEWVASEVTSEVD